MSDRPIPSPSGLPGKAPLENLSSSTASDGFVDRISQWVSEHKVAAYTIAGVTILATAGGVYYYYVNSDSKAAPAEPKASSTKKKSKKKSSKKKEPEEKKKETSDSTVPKPTVQSEESDIPENITEEYLETLTTEERQQLAARLKGLGNMAYGDRAYNRAIELYGQALLCKQDPIFYSNRAACYNAMGNWEKVIEDTTAAIKLNPEYVKALNRRAGAYEKTEKYSEALLDYTASCIIDQFRDQENAQSVERLLKTIAEEKGREILKNKPKRLPSPTFVSNYLQSFRPKPPPAGLEDDAELDEESGKGQLRKGLQSLRKKTADGYNEAYEAFNRAVDSGDLDEHTALGYNLRGTFRYMIGETADALEDLNKSIELDPKLTQSYVKRASMHLEAGNQEFAHKDFEEALQQDSSDPDIYYHRAQLRFISSDFSSAAQDYQKSIDLDPSFVFSHIQLGVTQYKNGSVASSMATFRRTIKNFTDTADVYNYYGELLLDQGKYQEAIERFETAIEMERNSKVHGMNVLPLINKALALYQWKNDYSMAEDLCKKALIIDPECDIAVATMAQLLLQQGKVTDALTYFERAADLSRTEGEIINALSYAEATRTQLEVQEKYPQLGPKLQAPMGGMMGGR